VSRTNQAVDAVPVTYKYRQLLSVLSHLPTSSNNRIVSLGRSLANCSTNRLDAKIIAVSISDIDLAGYKPAIVSLLISSMKCRTSTCRENPSRAFNASAVPSLDILELAFRILRFL